MLSCGAQQFSWMPLPPCWWLTAFSWQGSQNALQATCAVLSKTIEIIISTCPARIVKAVTARKDGNAPGSLVFTHCFDLLYMCSPTWVAELPMTTVHFHHCAFPPSVRNIISSSSLIIMIIIIIISSSLEIWKIQYSHLTSNWTVMGKSCMQIAIS